jgi:hypothetical protein
MKALVALLLATVVATFSLAASLHAQQTSTNSPSATPSPLTVHEWGTFTTLSGSDGVLLPGLYKEEASLPYFVHCSPGFSYGGYIHKGLYLECSDVTLKMETPVIYFYSDVARPVTVRVDWPGGTISQWYPERSDGEAPSSNLGYLDFSTPYNGWIQWNVNLEPKLNPDTIRAGQTVRNKHLDIASRY